MPLHEELKDLVLPLHENDETIPMLLEYLHPSATGALPFVGAGLSIPFDMPGWGEFLRKQARKADRSEQIDQQLARGEYEEAAQVLLETRGEFAFARAIKRTYGETRLRGKTFSGSAVACVSALTPGPVITTNFDLVLEAAYLEQGIRFDLVVW